MLFFFIHINPLNQPFLNRMEIFNECCLLISSYFLFLFTDFVPDVHTRYLIGWGFIGLQIFNIAVNWLCMIFKVYQALRVIAIKAYYKWKLNREKAQKLPETNPEKVDVKSKIKNKLKANDMSVTRQRFSSFNSTSNLKFEDP
jgi:hypothetical protein